MAHTADQVFSTYFLNKLGFLIPQSDSTYKAVIDECVGKLTETMNTKTITKKCRGRIKKSRTKGSDGTVTIEAHIPLDVLREIYSMQSFADGVVGYGTTCLHKEIILTAEVLDEDDNVMYKAYPVAVCNTKEDEIDDDADEIAMVSLEFTVTADDNEMIVYEALQMDVSEDIADQWMGNWSQELIAEAA